MDCSMRTVQYGLLNKNCSIWAVQYEVGIRQIYNSFITDIYMSRKNVKSVD